MVRITRWTKATPSCLLSNFRTAEVCSQANSSPWNVNGCQLTRRDGELCNSCTQHTVVTFHNHYTAVSHSLCITSNTQIRVMTVWMHNMKCSTDQGIFGKGKDDSWSMQQVIRWVLEHSSPPPPSPTQFLGDLNCLRLILKLFSKTFWSSKSYPLICLCSTP